MNPVDVTDDEAAAIDAASAQLARKVGRLAELEELARERGKLARDARRAFDDARTREESILRMSPLEQTMAIAEGRSIPDRKTLREDIERAAQRIRAVADLGDGPRYEANSLATEIPSARSTLARAVAEPARRRLVARLLEDDDVKFLIRCAAFMHNSDGPPVNVESFGGNSQELRVRGFELATLRAHRVPNIAWLDEQAAILASTPEDDGEDDDSEAPTESDEPDVELEDDAPEAAA